MIPLGLRSQKGLGDTWFAGVVMRIEDQRFFNFVSGNHDTIVGANINEKLQAIVTGSQSAYMKPLLDGSDNWYRAEVATLGDPEEITAYKWFAVDLISGNTADQGNLYVLHDELVLTSSERPYLGPEDPLTHPLGLLATHIANTSTFRVWCGLPAEEPESSDKLLTGIGFQRRIFWPAYYHSIVNVPGLLPNLPILVISPPSEGGLAMSKATDDDAYDHSGSIDVTIIDRSRAGLDLEKAGRVFMKRLGFLLKELQRIDHVNDRLGIEDETVGMSHGEPSAAEIATHGITFEGRFQVAWSG